MAGVFLGTWEVESRENFDGFLKGLEIPEEMIEKARGAKVVTEITKNGDVISVTRTRPMGTTTNSFTIGKEAELTTIKGEKVKTLVSMVGGKMIAKGEKYEVVTELVDGKLKETITYNGQTMSRLSVKK